LYNETFSRSISREHIDQYWREQLDDIKWIRKPSRILEEKEGSVFNKWFSDGLVNICENCVDRHARKDGSRKALIYDSAMTGQ